MAIKIILILFILLVLLRVFFRFKAKELTRLQFWGWLIIWLLAIIIIVFPQITSYLAIKLGVGRGVDLAVYSSIILLYYLVFRLFIRLEKMEKNITELVRKMALDQKQKNDPS